MAAALDEEAGRRLTSVAAIRDELNRLRDEAGGASSPAARTSVMTQVAWVPEQWKDAAVAAFGGLEDAHPSRAILLFPEPAAEGCGFEGEVFLRTFGRGGKQISAEMIVIWLHGATCELAASVVTPLVRSGLPVFLRWRGELAFGSSQLDDLVDLADRLIVDGREWTGPQQGYERLPDLFDRAAVSDVAWARTEPWRRAVAELWPGISSAQTLRVRSPEPEALLLSCWVRTRLGRDVELQHEPADEIELVAMDGHQAIPVNGGERSPSALLSHELELGTRDPIYEEAVCALSPPKT